MVKLKGKVFKVGAGYAMTIPKALVDGEILFRGSKYELELIGEVKQNKPGDGAAVIASRVNPLFLEAVHSPMISMI